MATAAKRVPKTVGEAARVKRGHPLVAAIQDAQDIPYKDVEVPEWPLPDGSPIELRIRGLNGRERDRYEAQMATFRSTSDGEMRMDILANRNARLLAQCLYDPETDELLPIGVDDLAAKSGEVITRLAQIALNLSGLGRGAVEDAGKGSKSGQNASSITG